MSKTSAFLKHNWRALITAVTFIAIFAFIFALRKEILQTFKNLQDVKPWAILLMLPMQMLNYHAQTKLHQSFLHIMGASIRYRELLKIILGLNFVNNIFPSGGVSGISYFSLRLKREGVRGGQSTLVQILKFGFLFISFQVLLFAGLLMLAVSGSVNNFLLLISGSLFTLLMVGTFAVAFIIGSEQRINGFFTYLTRAANRLIQLVRKGQPETINIAKVQDIFRDLHHNYMLVKREPRQLLPPLLYAMLANAAEIGTIYVVYVAFGQWVNPGAVIIAYAAANFAGFISILPGGVGIYEVLMTTVLAAAGVPVALAIPVTIMYRVLNMIIQLTPGYYFYHTSLQKLEENDA